MGPHGATSGPRPLLFRKGKLFVPPPSPHGHVALGKTRSGKSVYASGAESEKYDDEDHLDAARFHALAHEHHDVRAETHGEASGRDEDWRRSETHHQDHERHRKLADHHLDLIRHHLTAGGRAGAVKLGVGKDGKPVLSTATPADEKTRQGSREWLRKRTNHDHPGGVGDADRAAYGAFSLEDRDDGDPDD
jgi:hypothetical protein